MPASEPPVEVSSLFVVVPAFDEEARVRSVVAALRAVYPRVVVVDDGSRDGTGAAAREAGASVLRHALNRGQGAALQTGIEWALVRGAEAVVTFDADGQHRVEDLANLLAPIVAGTHDFVLGSRFLGRTEGMPPVRRLVLRAAVRFTRLSSGLAVTDAHNGLRAFSRRGAACLSITLDRMAHASELLDQIRRSGLRWCEVPVTVRYSAETLAKGQRSGAAVRVLVDYLTARWFQ